MMTNWLFKGLNPAQAIRWPFSVNKFSNLTSDDASLWGWGSNESGQIGLKTEIGIELYETANFPAKVAEDKLKGKKIVDFDLGENISVFLTGISMSIK